MDFLKDDPERILKLRNAVVEGVSILDLFREYDVNIENSNYYGYVIRCPFHEGKGGGAERTASLHIYTDTNSFHCFGCNAGGTVIDFVCLYESTPAIVAIKKLAKKMGLIDKDGNFDELCSDIESNFVFDPRKTIDPYIFDISIYLRNYLRSFLNTSNFEKELRCVERIGKKVDNLILHADKYDWEYVKDILDKVKNRIEGRTSKGKDEGSNTR